jgi:hypothetical protein
MGMPHPRSGAVEYLPRKYLNGTSFSLTPTRKCGRIAIRRFVGTYTTCGRHGKWSNLKDLEPGVFRNKPRRPYHCISHIPTNVKYDHPKRLCLPYLRIKSGSSGRLVREATVNSLLSNSKANHKSVDSAIDTSAEFPCAINSTNPVSVRKFPSAIFCEPLSQKSSHMHTMNCTVHSTNPLVHVMLDARSLTPSLEYPASLRACKLHQKKCRNPVRKSLPSQSTTL